MHLSPYYTMVVNQTDIVTNPYPLWATTLLWLLTVLFALETIVGNLLVLVSFFVDRSLRVGSNYFIASLAVSDLIIGIEGFPILTYYVSRGQNWLLPRFFCDLWLSIDYMLCLVSILTVLLITMDRYCSVCHTIRYRHWQSIKKVRIMIVVSWIVPAVLFSMTIYGWEALTGEKPKNKLDCSAPFLSDPYLNMSMYLVYYWATLAAMVVLYHGIHKVASKLQAKGEAKEKQAIAMAALQRCMAQMGVSVIIAAHNNTRADSNSEVTRTGICGQSFASRREVAVDSGYSTGAQGPTSSQSHTGPNAFISSVVAQLNETSVDEQPELTENSVMLHSVEDEPSQHSIAPSCASFESPFQSDYSSCEQMDCRKPVFQLSQSASVHRQGSSKVLKPKKDTDGVSICTNCTYVTAASYHSTSTYDSCTSARDISSYYPDSLQSSIRSYSGGGGSSTQWSAQSSLKFSEYQPFAKGVNEKDENNDEQNVDWPFSRSPSFTADEEELANHLKEVVKENLIEAAKEITVPDRSLYQKEIQNHQQEQQQQTLVPSNLPLRYKPSPILRHVSCRHMQRKENVLMSTLRQFRSTSIVSAPVHRRLNAKESMGPLSFSDSADSQSDDDEKLEKRVKPNKRKFSENFKLTSVQAVPSNFEIPSEMTKEPRFSKFSTLFNPTWFRERTRKRTRAEKRARKAFRTITIILGAFVLFWSPYYIFATLYGFCKMCVPDFVFLTSYYMCYLNSSVNPFCYALANRQFRAVFLRMLKGDFSTVKGRGPMAFRAHHSFV